MATIDPLPSTDEVQPSEVYRPSSDPAMTDAQRTATAALFNAVLRQDLAALHHALAEGACVNAHQQSPAWRDRQDGDLRAPLDLAWWRHTRTADGQERFPVSPTGETWPADACVSALLAAGAHPSPHLLTRVSHGEWDLRDQPTFLELERAILKRLHACADTPSMASTTETTSGPETAFERTTRAMVITGRQRTTHEESFLLNESVVPSTNAHGAHLWLHRAIERHDWVALHGWLNLDGVVATDDTDPVMRLVWETFMRAPTLDDPDRRAAITRLRARLLTEPEPIYRREVLALMNDVDRFEPRRPTASRAVPHSTPQTSSRPGNGLAAWLHALLTERALDTFRLNPLDQASRTDQEAQALQQRLVHAEQALLRTPLADVAIEPTAPRVGRPRL